MKKKILFKNEAHFINSGYGGYGRELMMNLHKTGKYELAQLATYASPNDGRLLSVPWKCYGNAPSAKSGPEFDTYSSNRINEYGLWRWEDTVLDFKPDYVMGINDIWGDLFTLESPLREYYNLAWMSTVDARPQEESWIASFTELDGLLCYSDFGGDVIKEQGGDRIKYFGSAGGGPDLNVFKPMLNKAEYKKQMAGSDCFLVGTVMRNQKRKLYPDLIKGFELFLKKCKEHNNHTLAEKTFLYIHTSYPDVGWDLPRLIKESGIGHKVFFSYFCKRCKQTFPSLWQDARIICRHCGHYSAMLPCTAEGTDLNSLAKIYNLFDVYVQYATLEGLGIPMLEAGACGVPIMAINYSAMEDVARKLKGIPLEPLGYYRESETHRYFSVPENQLFADELYKFLSLPETIRRTKGYNARKGVETNYNWDKITKTWMKFFDETPPRNKWNDPPVIHQPNTSLNPNVSSEEFVKNAILQITGDTKLLNSYKTQLMIRDLNYEWKLFPGNKPVQYGRNEVVNELLNYINAKNYWESRRVGQINVPTPDFIKYSTPQRCEQPSGF